MRPTTTTLTVTILTTLSTLLAAAGCHQPCGGCTDFESCQPATMSCVVNPGARFDLVAVDGHVDDSNRTLTDGLPNPEVCVALGSSQKCAAVQVLSYSPRWQQTLFSALDGALLLSTPLPVTYTDKGLFHDVDICHGSVPLVERYLHDGGFRFNCNNGSYVSFSLKNVARGAATSDGGGSD